MDKLHKRLSEALVRFAKWTPVLLQVRSRPDNFFATSFDLSLILTVTGNNLSGVAEQFATQFWANPRPTQ